MSYILDALRKSEYERRMRDTPTLDPLPNAPQPHPKHPGWLWPVIILMSLNLAALLFWLNRTSNMQQRSEQQLSEFKPAVITQVSEQKRREAIANRPHSLIVNEKSKLVKKTVTPTYSIVDLVAPASQSKPEQPVKKSQLKPPNRAITQPKTKSVPIKKAAKIVPSKKYPIQPAVQKSINKPPYLHTLSQDFQNRIPVIKMNVHMYSDNAKDSFAIINMTKYHTGEMISEGLKLEEITSNGLVLSFEGKTFQIDPN